MWPSVNGSLVTLSYCAIAYPTVAKSVHFLFESLLGSDVTPISLRHKDDLNIIESSTISVSVDMAMSSSGEGYKGSPLEKNAAQSARNK